MNVRRLGALISVLALAVAAVPRITVNDRPLEVAPISANGRVLVPMRAIFESLGARLDYDVRTHTVTADGDGHSVRLQIGNASAVVDGRAVALDVPARVVAASTYVPLRFVAQSLGAVVGYDNAASLVTVTLNGTTFSSNVNGSRRVGSLLPAPNSTIGTGYPTISAVIGGNVPVASANLSVDGVDVTDATTFDGTTMTYIPQQGLNVGTHHVSFAGVDRDGAPFDSTWSFTTDVAPAPDFGSSVPFQFYLENGGNRYGYGDELDFVLQGPPGGTAYLTSCASSQRFYLNGDGPYYRGSLRAPYGLDNGYCPIEAVYVGWNGRIWYAPVPIFVHLRPRGPYDNGGRNHGRPHDRPTPTPTPDHWPPKPTPTPNPSTPHQPWPGETPAPPIARPPHRPAGTPMPQPTSAPPQAAPTAAPRPERTPRQPDPTDPPAATPQPAPPPTPEPQPPQPREPHTQPHPVQTPPV